jgi:hypothetical protein
MMKNGNLLKNKDASEDMKPISEGMKPVSRFS